MTFMDNEKPCKETPIPSPLEPFEKGAPLYKMELANAACPSFCSCLKPFFGTLEEVRAFVAAYKGDREEDGAPPEILSAFAKWEAGDHAVTHWVSFSLVPLLVPAELRYTERLTLSFYQWPHTNIWGCIYSLRCSKVTAELRWLACEKDCFCSLMADFKDLEWSDETGVWYPVEEEPWGTAHLLCFEKNHVRNRLAVPQKHFDSLQKLEEDHQRFLCQPSVDFSSFCEEIFGDG